MRVIQNRPRRRVKVFILSTKFWWLLTAVFGFSRLATWLFPFDSDHWIFYYVGKHWFEGQTLYLRIWDHKAPVIFSINGFMHSLLGDSILLHRIFLTGVAILGTWLFYITCKRLLRFIGRQNIEGDARIATLFYAFWSNLSQFTNSGNNAENFGVVILLAAVYCYLRYTTTKRWKWLLYSGVAVSYVVFLKLNFGLLLLPLILDFVGRERKNLLRLLSLSLVWVIPTGLQALAWYSYFAPRNLLKEFWIASVEFNGKYLRSGWAGNLSEQKVFLGILAVALLFFIGALFYAWRLRKTERRSTVLLMAGAALLFSVILGTFYGHYYLIVLPYLCFVAGAYWRVVVKSRIWLALAVIGLLGSFAISSKQLYNRFWGAAASDAKAMSAAAQYVRDNSTEKDKIIFDGYGATFYQLSGRDSASRYISASHPLIDEREGFGYNLTDKYLGDMSMNRPKYVVVDLSTVRIYNQNRPAAEFFKKHYVLDKELPGYEIYRIK